MHDLAKLCNDKLCKSAFHKSLAKQNNRKKKQKTKQSLKTVTVHDVTEKNCMWAVLTTARVELKAD